MPVSNELREIDAQFQQYKDILRRVRVGCTFDETSYWELVDQLLNRIVKMRTKMLKDLGFKETLIKDVFADSATYSSRPNADLFVAYGHSIKAMLHMEFAFKFYMLSDNPDPPTIQVMNRMRDVFRQGLGPMLKEEISRPLPQCQHEQEAKEH